MQKQVYTSNQNNRQTYHKMYNRVPAGQMHRDTAQLQPVEPPVVAPSRARRSKRAGIVMLVSCMLLALLAVLLVPLLASGAVQPGVAANTAPVQNTPPETKQQYNTLAQAQEALGFEAVLPTSLPEGMAPQAYRAVNGKVLEVEYKIGKSTIVYRTAPGSQEISGDERRHMYSTTEETGGVARTYAGVTEEKLSLAIWATDGMSYAIVADGALDANVLKEIAQGV